MRFYHSQNILPENVKYLLDTTTKTGRDIEKTAFKNNCPA